MAVNVSLRRACSGVHVHYFPCLKFIYSDSDKFNTNMFSRQELYITTVYVPIYEHICVLK